MAGGADDASGLRRRRLSEDERRSQIIDGCVAVLASEGMPRASLARIAQTAGVSKGLITHYFGDRETLMVQTAISTANRLQEDAVASIDTTGAAPDVVRAAIRYAATLNETHSAELRAIEQIAHGLPQPDGTFGLTTAAYEDTYRNQERLFERGQDEGSFCPFDRRLMAVIYQGAIDAMIGYLEDHPEIERHAFADQASEVLLRAMGAEASDRQRQRPSDHDGSGSELPARAQVATRCSSDEVG